MSRRLAKSSSDKMVFGVCGGIAEYFEWDPTLVRVGFVVAAIAGFASLLVYLVMALIMPDN